MSASSDIGLLFLHALPLDGSMWDQHRGLFNGLSDAPTLYGLGNTLEAWAEAALKIAKGNRLIVVGCSVGGFCALEVAVLAPERVAALVLISTKAQHRPDSILHASALDCLQTRGISGAWAKYWEPLFSQSADNLKIEAARNSAMAQRPEDIARGVTVFHSRQNRHQLVSDAQCPIVVVSGDEDIAPGKTYSADLAASAKRNRLHVIPNCGHYVPLEQPEILGNILHDVIDAVA
ncbi:MAG: alpha/beta hydrolase [Pseudomonadota bacterium]